VNKEEKLSYLQELNPEQLKAVIHSGSPLLILAGAGSGKTRVITTKIVFALDQLAVRPEAILAVTFTNKAAMEMKSRAAVMNPLSEKVMIRTFHSFAAWLLRVYGAYIGIKPGFLIYDEDDSFALLKQDLKESFSQAQIKQYLYWICRAKDLGISPTGNLTGISYDRELVKVYTLYQEHLSATGNLDFGDLILKSIELLQASDRVKKMIHDRFTMILVDEYQDSNVAQFKLLQEIYAPSAYLCVVGDDDQSIYKFRGAEVENIITFPEHFPNTEVIRLERNYRSTQNILAAASAVVANNLKRMGKNLTTLNMAGKSIVAAYLADHTQEAQFCAEILKQGRYEETAILYRMNYQSRHFEELFLRLGIPYCIVGTQRFYEREEVKDALSYLSLLLNPHDELAFLRVINKPARGIGKASLKIVMEERQQSNSDFISCCRTIKAQLSKKAGQGLESFVSFLDFLSLQLEQDTLSHFIHLLLEKSGLLAFYEEKDRTAGSSKCANLFELINAALPYQSGREGLLQFLENTMLNSPELNDPEQGKVTLITVHNTKGLEFERVIITGLEEGVFPTSSSVNDYDISPEELEEERRLFYVGITRAKKELYLTSCRSRTLFGRFISAMPSRFLAEIPRELVEEHILTAGGSEAVPGRQDENFPRGARIFHDEYGYGNIIQSENKGEHLLVTVRFDTGKTARFIPEYSGLLRIREE
jgi:DNA helicase-2/ATP-dependent DNA helicase PcrA